jgi:hypothetical protein
VRVVDDHDTKVERRMPAADDTEEFWRGSARSPISPRS